MAMPTPDERDPAELSQRRAEHPPARRASRFKKGLMPYAVRVER